MIESLRAHYNQLELKEINHETKTEDPGVEDVDNSGEEVDVAPNKGQLEECNENVIESPEKPETTSVSNTSSPKGKSMFSHLHVDQWWHHMGGEGYRPLVGILNPFWEKIDNSSGKFVNKLIFLTIKKCKK